MFRGLLVLPVSLCLGSCGATDLVVERSPVTLVLESGEDAPGAAKWIADQLSHCLDTKPGHVKASAEGSRLLVEIPTGHLEDGLEILRFWSAKPEFAFASVLDEDGVDPDDYVEGRSPPQGWRVLPFRDRAKGHLLVAREAEFDRGAILDAETPAVTVEFTEEAAGQMRAFTEFHRDKPIAILLGEEVLSAPIVREPFSEGATITGNFTASETTALAAYFRDPPDFSFSVAE